MSKRVTERKSVRTETKEQNLLEYLMFGRTKERKNKKIEERKNERKIL